jgi:hypothetical protein
MHGHAIFHGAKLKTSLEILHFCCCATFTPPMSQKWLNRGEKKGTSLRLSTDAHKKATSKVADRNKR